MIKSVEVKKKFNNPHFIYSVGKDFLVLVDSINKALKMYVEAQVATREKYFHFNQEVHPSNQQRPLSQTITWYSSLCTNTVQGGSLG